MNENRTSTIFLPSKSNGGLWSIGFLIGTLLIFCVPLAFLGIISDPWYIGMMVVFILLMGIIFGVTVHGYYSMKYIIADEFLILRWSFFKKIIPLREISTISSVSKDNLQGIRSFGVGIPGHLVGRFQLRFNGEFMRTALYATNLDNLVVIRTLDKKTYGVTPENTEYFINHIQSAETSVKQAKLDTSLPVQINQKTAKKTQSFISIVFIISVILTVGTFVYFIIAYQGLPETGIPLHWNIYGEVDRFGNRSELLIMVSIFSGIEVLLNSLVYLWMRKSDLGKVRMGKIIILVPFIITLVFSVLMTVILQSTLNYF